MIELFDTWSQMFIVFTGLFSVYLMSSADAATRMYGGFTGLIGEPFWLATAMINNQYGVMILVVVYGINWIRAFRVNRTLVESTGGKFSLLEWTRQIRKAFGEITIGIIDFLK